MTNSVVPVIGFAAFSGAGKTTLLLKLISIFNKRNIRIAVIKHSHHRFNIDLPGKDSHEFRKSGAKQVLIASSNQWALMVESEVEHPLEYHIQNLQQDALDLILIEGYKHAAIPKIEVYRPGLGLPLLSEHDNNIIAIATDDISGIDSGVSILNLNEPDQIAQFIIDTIMKEAQDKHE
jgi:molybdopterin-guanine dinucleotide biosynthesis protein MobB